MSDPGLQTIALAVRLPDGACLAVLYVPPRRARRVIDTEGEDLEETREETTP